MYSEAAPEDCSVVEQPCRSAVERSGRQAAVLECRSVVAPLNWLVVYFPVLHLA